MLNRILLISASFLLLATAYFVMIDKPSYFFIFAIILCGIIGFSVIYISKSKNKVLATNNLSKIMAGITILGGLYLYFYQDFHWGMFIGATAGMVAFFFDFQLKKQMLKHKK